MKTNYFLSVILIVVLPYIVQAQFTTGSDGLFITAGTSVFIDNFTLTPNMDITISNNSLEVSNVAIPGTPQSSILRVYEWDSPINFIGTVGFYYLNTELNSNIAATLELQYSSQNGNGGFTPISSSVPLTNYVSAAIPLPGINLKQLTAASTGVVLPVTWLGFEVKKEGKNAALLQWATAQEKNSSHFLIERSHDAHNFEIVGRINSLAKNGNSSTILNYNFIDQKPLKGHNYYRLKQFDFDNEYMYSPVRSLWFEEQNKISVFPNPTKLYLNIEGLKGTEKIQVYDALGRIVINTQSTTTNYQLNVEHLAAGNYSLHILGEGTNAVYKIEKSE